MSDPQVFGRPTAPVTASLPASPFPSTGGAAEATQIRRGYTLLLALLGLCLFTLVVGTVGQLSQGRFSAFGLVWSGFFVWTLWLTYAGRLWARVMASLLMLYYTFGYALTALAFFTAAGTTGVGGLRGLGALFLGLAVSYFVSVGLLWFAPPIRAYFNFVGDELN